MFDMQKVKEEIYIDGFNSIYYFEFSKNFAHAPEQHNFWEMVYIDSGTVNAVTNGVGCKLSQGQAIFHEPMELHAHISDHQVPNNMLIVSFTSNSKAMENFKGKTFTLDKTSKTLLSLFLEEAKNALGTIPSSYKNRGNLSFSPTVFGASQLLQCHFTEFLIKLIRTQGTLSSALVSNKKTRNIATNSMCELICDYMKRNVALPLNQKELCSHFLIGKTQLCKIFHDSMGIGPMEHFSKIKIEEAKKLIRQGGLSVSQIADSLGYGTIHAFSRTFKKQTGLSPLNYKKSIL